tara:strand:- start:2697 stop:3284 length:588 start_codon:yes stop_codon:yes gene_type:complete
MKTRLDETNKMRRLMGLSILTEQETLDNIESSPLDNQLKLSKEQGKKLEEELRAAVEEAERLKIEKNLSKIKLEAYLEQLKSNRVSGKILKRENKNIKKLERQIEKLENTTSETRNAASKKILKGILGVLVASLSIVVIKNHPILKMLIRKISSLKIPNSTTPPNSGGGVVPIGGGNPNTGVIYHSTIDPPVNNP